MKKYVKVYILMTINSIQSSFSSRGGAVLFISGKAIRFAFFWFLLSAISGKTSLLGQYKLEEIIFFFLTFNLVDILAQSFFREVYRFRSFVISGDFDLILVKPINPLFRVLLGGADAQDMLTLIPIVGLIVYFATKLPGVSFASTLLYLALITNAVLMAAAFHVVVLVLGILTTAVDHTIWMYRDLTSMGRIPVDFYNQNIRSLLTFIFPVSIMMTIPAKAMMSLVSPVGILYSVVGGTAFFFLSLFLWKWSLRKYSSASS